MGLLGNTFVGLWWLDRVAALVIAAVAFASAPAAHASTISGATVFSDSTVTTAKGSSAVVSLGKLGRVE